LKQKSTAKPSASAFVKNPRWHGLWYQKLQEKQMGRGTEGFSVLSCKEGTNTSVLTLWLSVGRRILMSHTRLCRFLLRTTQ
jgi:hypothetical protein